MQDREQVKRLDTAQQCCTALNVCWDIETETSVGITRLLNLDCSVLKAVNTDPHSLYTKIRQTGLFVIIIINMCLYTIIP